MFKIWAVICDNGDGSQYLEWHKEMSKEIRNGLLREAFDTYASGDGVQDKEFKFDTEEEMNNFIKNNIPEYSWYEGESE